MEQKKFKQEVIPLRKQLFSYAQRLLNDAEDVEDIVQEIFLKLWLMRSELEQYNNILALSMQMTKHLCLNRLKVSHRQQETLTEFTLISDVETPDILLEQKNSVEHVIRIIDQLPTLRQMILRMKHLDGFEVEEIAKLIGSTPEAVRMNLSRARKKVRDTFLREEKGAKI
jgi:RNA polymerase sigma-70 factor (ECF subfamily)